MDRFKNCFVLYFDLLQPSTKSASVLQRCCASTAYREEVSFDAMALAQSHRVSLKAVSDALNILRALRV